MRRSTVLSLTTDLNVHSPSCGTVMTVGGGVGSRPAECAKLLNALHRDDLVSRLHERSRGGASLSAAIPRNFL